MIASVIVQNVAYVGGAIVLIVILSLLVTLRHRKPKSVESNMASFNKGLKALAPDAEPGPKSGLRFGPKPSAPKPARSIPTIPPSRGKTVQTVLPEASPSPLAAPEGEPDIDAEAAGANAAGGDAAGGDRAGGDRAEDAGGDEQAAPETATRETPTRMEAETG